jgi:hypothetical protein
VEITPKLVITPPEPVITNQQTTEIILKDRKKNPEELPDELKSVYNEVTEKYKLQW